MTDRQDALLTEAREIVLARVAEQFDDAVAMLSSMIQIPSVGPWFGAPAAVSGEGRIQEFLRTRLEALGAQIDEWEPDVDGLSIHAAGPGYFADRDFSGRPNLVGRVQTGANPRPALMFLGHCDVVPAGDGWAGADPFAGRIADGRIHGRGACDMKGGMAAAYAAMRAVLESPLRLGGDVWFGSVTEEETGGMGTLALVDRGDLPELGIIIPEPTSLKVAPLCRGIIWGEITIQGRSGHIETEQPSWKEGGAVDAIAYGRRLLDSIDAMNARWAALPEKSHRRLPSPCRLSVAEIHSGTYPSAWADSFTIRFDVQYLPSELDEHGGGGRIREQITRLVEDFAADDEWLTQHPPVITWLVDADCGETEEDDPIVQAPLQAMRALGLEPVVEGMTCHTDMGLPIKAGVPTITFGPGQLNVAHQPDEYLDLEEYRRAIEIMALTVLERCGVEAAGAS